MHVSAKEGFYHGYDNIGATAITSDAQIWKSFDRGRNWGNYSAVGSNNLNTFITNVLDTTVDNTGNIFAIGNNTGSNTMTNGTNFTIVKSSDGLNWVNAGYIATSLGTSAPTYTFNSMQATANGIYVSCFNGLTADPGGIAPNAPVSIPWYVSGNATSNNYTEAVTGTSGYAGPQITASLQSAYLATGLAYYSPQNAAYGGYFKYGNTSPSGAAYLLRASSTHNDSAIQSPNPGDGNWYSIINGSDLIFKMGVPITFSSTGVHSGATGWGEQMRYSSYSYNATGNTSATNFVLTSGSASNTCYTYPTSTPAGTWTKLTVGSSTTVAPQALCPMSGEALIYRRSVFQLDDFSSELFVSNNQGVTLTNLGLPISAKWRGIYWQP